MNRLESLVKSRRLEGKRIVVTGCGCKPLQKEFYDFVTGEPTQDSIIIDGEEMKLNIGSAVAGVLALNGADVHMVSTSEDKLRHIKENLKNIVDNNLQYSTIDLLDDEAVRDFVFKLPKDKPIYWVQSVGLGAGSYKLKDNNPYLPIDEIPIELLEKESQIVLRATHLMMQKLLPIFREQNKKFKTETRVAIISSMSAIRGYNLGVMHCAAKGAISRYTNSAMLDLWKERIFITDVRPGVVDTGMYDSESVIEAVKKVGKSFGIEYINQEIPLAPPTSVGEAINYIFTTSAHIPSLNLVARGQFPHEGS